MNVPQTRINLIDWAKAIAIYAVVLGHVSRSTDPQWVVEVAKIGRIFHVPLFFLISGFLFRVKEDNFWLFIRNAVKSLVVPYLFFNILSAAILWKLQAPEIYQKGLEGFFLVKGYAFAGPAWFLIVLFLIKLMAYWLKKIPSERLQWLAVLAVILVVAVLPVKIDMGVSAALLSFPFFFIGGWLKTIGVLNSCLRASFSLKIAVFAVLMMTCVLLRGYHNMSMDLGNAYWGGNIIMSYLYVLLYVLMALSLCLLLDAIQTGVVKTISASCIVIMGLHMTIVQILWAYSNKFPDAMAFLFRSPTLSLTSFVLSILVAMFLMRYAPSLIGNRK